MNQLRSVLRLTLLLPILVLAVSVSPGEASRAPTDLVAAVGLDPGDEGAPGQQLAARQGTFSNGFCTGAPRDW